MIVNPNEKNNDILSLYPVCNTGSVALATFTDGANDVPIKSCVVNIKPIQEGTGDPSPDNVRPITGWTRCTISHSGSDTTNPETIVVDLEDEAGTVYSGTLTLNEDGSADLVSTHVTYNIQPSQWTWMSSSHCFKINRTSLSPRYKVFGSNVDNRVADIASNKYKPNTFNNIANNANNPNYSVGIREHNAQWLALRTNGTNSILPEECQIKLPLATPITRHISDAGQLKTFLGTNNVWADTGTVNLTYRADIPITIQNLKDAIVSLGGNV